MRDAAPLPSFSELGIQKAPENVDAQKIASEWLEAFASHVQSGAIDKVLSLFVEKSYWRDLLALTWDFRTFDGHARIKNFVESQLKELQPTSFTLKADEIFGFQQPLPDVVWVQSSFEFETKVGKCSGIFRLVPVPGDQWKCHSMFTNLEELKGFPEKLGPLRNHEPNHGKWESQRIVEAEFKNEDPAVLIIGGGQSGLDVAARLKVLDVKTLIIEKNARIGDNWRNRYDALCLHDPVWYDHLPYLPFPSTWPVFSPALKLANWLESYAESMELNIWKSSTVVSAAQHPSSKKWDVVIERGDGTQRKLVVNHVVFATGWGGGKINMPTYPGTDAFKGQILHSSQHKKATDHKEKKVVVVGACTSAHDICVDYVDHGVDVTMFQRSSTYVLSVKKGLLALFAGVYEEGGPPTDLADKLSASFSNLMKNPLLRLQTQAVAEADKETLEGLKKRGFNTNMGPDGCGILPLLWIRGGGYYPDVGGSQYIIDGKIKIKSSCNIEKFTETGIKFDDGSELSADVVVFCTGVGSANDRIGEICGEEIAEKCGRIWGLNDEGEVNGVWRDLGLPGLWYMMGNLSFCRFHSKHVALQIKAMEEGLFGSRYQA